MTENTDQETAREQRERIERRLREEKYMSDDQVEMVMAVVEEELTGSTDREAIDWVHDEVGVRKR